MPLFFRKRRRKKKTASQQAAKSVTTEAFVPDKDGYNPYDTLPGRPRDEFGMRRQEDGKWSF